MIEKASEIKFLLEIVFVAYVYYELILLYLIIVAMGIGKVTYGHAGKNSSRDIKLRVEYKPIKQMFGLKMRSETRN